MHFSVPNVTRDGQAAQPVDLWRDVQDAGNGTALCSAENTLKATIATVCHHFQQSSFAAVPLSGAVASWPLQWREVILFWSKNPCGQGWGHDQSVGKEMKASRHGTALRPVRHSWLARDEENRQIDHSHPFPPE